MQKYVKEKRIAAFGPYLAAFLVPILVMIVVFIERGIWPFGDKCFLRTDLYHQYAPFFRELRSKITGGGSLFYSWNIGGGTNFWTLSAYYLADPFNLLVALVPKSFTIEFITGMILVKLGLCSVTMTYYLNCRNEKTGLDRYGAVFFGIFYALSGYTAAYNWNIMWLDCLWLFPLVIRGLDLLVREEKGFLYGISLAYSFFSNYYIGFMVALGVAVYCFFLLGTEKKMLHRFGWKLLIFIAYTVLAVMFSAVYLLPYIHYFGMTASATSSFRWEWYSYFSVFDMLSRQLMNVEVHTALEHWPNIYSGIAAFLLVPLYFLNRKISLREKIGYMAVLIFFWFSFSTRAMDYIWHVFHIPNSLPCRQSFIYTFFLLVIAFRGFDGIRDRSYRDITFTLVAALGFTFLAEKLEADKEIFTNYVFYVSALFFLFYGIWLYAWRRGRIFKDVLLIAFIALAATEACVNLSVTGVPTVTRSQYMEYDDGVESIMEEIRREEGNDFYRVEKVNYRTKNDGAWLSYPSVSTFSSVANAHLTDFYKLLGLEASTNAYGSMGQTPFTNMLLGVRYSVSEKKLPGNEDFYEPYNDNGDNVYVYKNRYALPLGYMIDPSVISDWEASGKTPLDNQNELAELCSGVSGLFTDVTPYYAPSSAITVPIMEDGYYYVYAVKSGPKEIQVTSDTFSKKYSNLNRGYTMSIGYLSKGDDLKLTNVEDKSTRDIDITVYKLDVDKLEKVYRALSKTVMTVDSFTDTEVKAHIDVKTPGLLLTSIAAEDGWELYVDNVKTEYETAKDAYIAIPLTEGTHLIEFRFHVVWFSWCLALTVLSAACFVLIFIVRRKRERRFDRITGDFRDEDPEERLFLERAERQENAETYPEENDVRETAPENDPEPSSETDFVEVREEAIESALNQVLTEEDVPELRDL